MVDILDVAEQSFFILRAQSQAGLVGDTLQVVLPKRRKSVHVKVMKLGNSDALQTALDNRTAILFKDPKQNLFQPHPLRMIS